MNTYTLSTESDSAVLIPLLEYNNLKAIATLYDKANEKERALMDSFLAFIGKEEMKKFIAFFYDRNKILRQEV